MAEKAAEPRTITTGARKKKRIADTCLRSRGSVWQTDLSNDPPFHHCTSWPRKEKHRIQIRIPERNLWKPTAERRSTNSKNTAPHSTQATNAHLSPGAYEHPMQCFDSKRPRQPLFGNFATIPKNTDYNGLARSSFDFLDIEKRNRSLSKAPCPATMSSFFKSAARNFGKIDASVRRREMNELPVGFGEAAVKSPLQR